MIASDELQKVVYAALNGSITGTVHDEVPATQAAPYTVIGEITSVPWDTHDEDGSEETVTIHVWDDQTGSLRAKQIMGEIDAILHDARFTLATGETGWMRRDFAGLNKEVSDGKMWRHGVLRFRAFYS